MEKIDKIMTQEEYAEIRAEITRLEMIQSLTGEEHSKQIAELKAKIS